MNIKYFCNHNLEELKAYKHSKDVLLETYITQRLNESFNNYQKDLNTRVEYLTRRKPINVVKKMNRRAKLDAKLRSKK